MLDDGFEQSYLVDHEITLIEIIDVCNRKDGDGVGSIEEVSSLEILYRLVECRFVSFAAFISSYLSFQLSLDCLF